MKSYYISIKCYEETRKHRWGFYPHFSSFEITRKVFHKLRNLQIRWVIDKHGLQLKFMIDQKRDYDRRSKTIKERNSGKTG